MIPLSRITDEEKIEPGTKYNKRIPLSQIVGANQEPQEEKGSWMADAAAFIDEISPLKQVGTFAANVAKDVVDEVAPDSAASKYLEQLINPNIARHQARGLTAVEQPFGAGLKALGAILTGEADSIDKRSNPNGDNPYVNSSPMRTLGELLGEGGDYFTKRADSDERQKAFLAPREDYGSIGDLVTNPSKLARYATDPAGLGQDIDSAAGNALFFYALSKLMPTVTAGGRLPEGIMAAGTKGVLDTTGGLLGRAGLDKAARVVGSKGLRDFVTTGAQFAPSMGVGGAVINAGTIVDELRNQGLSDEEIAQRVTGLIGEELPYDVANAMLTGNLMKGKIGEILSPPKASTGRKLLANLAGVPLGVAGGHFSNLEQAILSEKYSGKPYGDLLGNNQTQYEQDASRIGALAEAMFGVAGVPAGVRNLQVRDQIAQHKEQAQNLSDILGKTVTDDSGNTRYADGSVYGDFRRTVADNYEGAARRSHSGANGIDAFVNAISGQESGGDYNAFNDRTSATGKYQIIPETWARWLNDLGMPADTPMTPENQDHVARQKMLEMYNEFGNWRDVAVAWYAGEDEVRKPRRDRDVKQGNGDEPSINEYADSVMSRFQNAGGEESGGRRPPIDIQSGLNSARKALDGKQMDNSTVGCVEAVTKILAHVHPEFQKMVDDGVVNTVEGENSLYSRLEKMGVEIVPFDEANVAPGDIIFYDGKQTYQHVLVADHKDADGNWRVFGNSSSANKVMEQPLYQGQTPSWIAKVSNINGGKSSPTDTTGAKSWNDYVQEHTRHRQEEPPMQARQVDLNDSGLHDAFARDRMTAAIDNNDADAAGFWGKMFDGDAFKNTEENRAAVRQRYGTELEQFAQTYEPATAQAEQPQTVQTPTPRAQGQGQGQGQTQQQQAQPQQQKPTAKNTSNKYIRNDNVMQAGNNFLEELRAKGTQADMETTVRLQAAISNGDTATVENILKANNRPIVAEQQTAQTQPQQQQQTQPQTDPVKQNGTPENVLAQQQQPQQQEATQPQQPAKPKKQPKTAEEKAQSALAKPLQSKKVETRRKAGNAVIFLADKNGIEISDTDRKSLENGKTAVVNQWRDTLISKGILSPQATQSPLKQSSPAQPQPQQQTQPQTQETTQPQEAAQPAEKPLTLQERAQQIVNKAAQQSWQETQDKYRERAKATWEQRVQEREDEIRARQKEAEAREEELRARQAEQEEITRRRSQEEYERAVQEKQDRELKAKQAKELQELEARQAEEKRLRDEARARQEQNEAEREEERDAESERLESRKDEAEALEELFEEESPANPKGKPPKEKQETKPATEEEKPTPQKFATELDEIEGVVNAEGIDPQTARYAITRFASALKKNLAKLLPADKFPKTYAEAFNRVDDMLLDGMKGLNDRSKNKKDPAGSVRDFRKSVEEIFNTVHRAVGDETQVERHENDLEQKTPSKQYAPTEKISEEEVFSDEQDAEKEPSKEVSKLTDKLKKLLDERVGLKKSFPDGRNRLFSTIDKAARRAGDDVSEFKKFARDLLDDANSGQLKAQLETYEPTPSKRRYSSSPKKDPQAAEKAKIRADKLKADIETLLPQLDKYPNLKADIFKIIDHGVNFAGKSGQSSKFSSWALHYLDSLKDLVKEKSKTKEGIGSWLEQQERQLSRQKEPTDVSSKETKPAEAKTEEKPKPEPKSMEGEADTRITNVIEDESTLTPPQKLLQSFSEKLGVPLKFFRNPDGKFHGSFSNGVLFLNANSKKGLGGVFWHEAFHWLKANNPKLYAKLVDAAGITPENRKAFLERTGRKDLKTNEGIDEEILADQMDDVAKRTGLLQSIAGKNRGVVERVVQWLKDTMNKFIETFRNPTGRLTTKQAQALAKEFGRIARQLKDENGNAIFRVNNRTGDIEVVEGRKARELSKGEVEAAAKSLDRKLSFAGIKALTADLNAFDKAEEMANKGASREEIFKETKLVRGKDGLYRFEIPDNLDKIDFAPLVKNGRAILGEIYKNSKLYAAYPKLRDIEVVATSKRLGENGAYWLGFEYDPVKGHTFTERISINLSPKGLPVAARKAWAKQQRGSLIHEIQHAIQAREQFATGGNAQNVRAKLADAQGNVTIAEGESDHDLYWRLGGEQEAREAQDRAELKALKKEEKRLRSELIDIVPTLPPDTQKKFKDFITAVKAKSDDIFDIADSLPDDANKDILTDWAAAVDDIEEFSKGNGRIPQIHGDNAIIIWGEYDANAYSAQSVSNPNDNSSESWGQRVANFTRAAIGLRRPAPERIHQKMKRQLSELSDLKIAAGHLPEGVQEKIDEVAKVIRTGKEYDWVKVLPAVGNAVAAQLGITQSAEMGNYIGKFLYGESAPDTSAEAQEFQEAMRKNEDMRDKILACRDTFSQWRNMSTEEQMIASMRFEEEQKPFRTRRQNFWKGFKTQFVESLTPVQSAVDAFEKRTGMKLDDVINPMTAFRLLRGMDGRAFRMIEGGEKTVKALQAALPNLNLDNWKTIRMILEPIGAFEDQKKREAFSAYITACHVMDIHRQNNNNLKKQAETQSKIDALKDELKLAGSKKERARIEKSIERQEETLDSLKRNIKDIAEAWDTEEKCQTVINKHKDEFGAAQKELVDYSNSLLAMRVDAGLMTLERFNELLNIYPNYVPLHRVIDEVSGGDKADSMAHMAGSAKDIYDPIHAIMSNTFDTVRRCEKNKAKCLLATLARFDGVGKIFEEVENGNGDGTTITFYENGKKKHLQCSDETLVKAVNNLTPPSMNWFIRALRIPTRILKGTATVLNVNFGVRNVLRDSQDAYIFGAKHGGNVFKDIAKFMTPYAALKGAYDAFQMNDVFEEFMVNGGAQSTFLTFDANYEQDAFDTLIKGKYKRFASAKGVLKLLETLGSYSEIGTRLGRFEQVKNNLKEKHGGINIYGDLVSAALESRDLMDFARGGEAGRTMNALSAFANPAIQGWDKFFRTFDYKKLKRFGGTDETQRQWMTSAARLVIDSIVPAFLLTLLHHDDDWYKKDVQDWEKETHWILSDTIRIPKPADVGARFFSNFTEKMMVWALDKEPATFKKVFAPLWASLPDLLPTAMQPVIECLTNYDMFRRSPIVPQRESKLPPELQYDSQSSNLAKFIGEKTGVSPRYIDHFIYGYTSNFGKGITRGVDTITYKAGLSDRPPAFTRDWIPIIGGFLRVPYRNPKIVQDYYEALDKQESLLNGYKERRKRDRNAKPPEEYDRALHARLKGAQNAMRALAAQERKVIEDQRLSSEEVDKRQREIQKRRVALCERVLGKAR